MVRVKVSMVGIQGPSVLLIYGLRSESHRVPSKMRHFLQLAGVRC